MSFRTTEGPPAVMPSGGDRCAALVAPTVVRTIDVDGPLPETVVTAADAGGPYRALVAIVRVAGHPLGSVVVPTIEGDVSSDAVTAAIHARLGPAVRRALEAPERLVAASAARAGSPLGAGRDAGSGRERPWVTVVVTTCRNPIALERCLASVLASTYDRFEVVVVENRPGSPATETLLADRFSGHDRLRYVEESRPGLSWARNAGLASAAGAVVAFTDDDVMVEPDWIARAAGVFRSDPTVACVTGLILPLRLATPTQVLLEQFAGFGKGFERQAFRLPDSRVANPLFPHTAGHLGSGANTFVWTRVARDLGGFDTNLGTGTLACGGEDLDFFIRLLHGGHTLVYEPSVILWHEHPNGLRRLRRQVYRYGVGLTAMLTKQLVTGPERRRILRLAPAGFRYAFDPASRKNEGKPVQYPRSLRALECVGMVVGPGAYLAAAVTAPRGHARGRPAAVSAA